MTATPNDRAARGVADGRPRRCAASPALDWAASGAYGSRMDDDETQRVTLAVEGSPLRVELA